jgi:hypothetical protein
VTGAPFERYDLKLWIGCRAECLDWLLIVGRGHLEQILRIYVRHYNEHRPHRALGSNRLISPPG